MMNLKYKQIFLNKIQMNYLKIGGIYAYTHPRELVISDTSHGIRTKASIREALIICICLTN